MTVVRYHVQLVTEKKLRSATGQLCDMSDKLNLLRKPPPKMTYSTVRAAFRKRALSGVLRLASRRENTAGRK